MPVDVTVQCCCHHVSRLRMLEDDLWLADDLIILRLSKTESSDECYESAANGVT